MSCELSEIPVVKAETIVAHIMVAMNLAQSADSGLDLIAKQSIVTRAEQALAQAEVIRRFGSIDIMIDMQVNAAIAHVRQRLRVSNG